MTSNYTGVGHRYFSNISCWKTPITWEIITEKSLDLGTTILANYWLLLLLLNVLTVIVISNFQLSLVVAKKVFCQR